MKEMFKNIARQIIYLYSKILCRIFFFKKENKALVLVPSWEGSIGDEAVIDSITTNLKERGIGTTLIHFGNKIEWNNLQSIDNRHNIPKYFKSGGWIEHFKLSKQLVRHKYFYALGTDMLDGCYAEWLTIGLLRLTKQAAVSGLKTNVVGFSINTWQNKNCIKTLGNLPKKVKLCVRDNVSKNRLQSLIPHRTLSLTADMAFLLKPTKTSGIVKDLEAWIKNNKKNQRLVVGINVSPQLFNDKQKTDDFISLLHTTLLKIEKQEHHELAFVFIPHDLRDYNSDLTILTDLYQKCLKDSSYQLFLVDEKIMSSEIKYIAGMLDLVITGRMHLSIASLGQCTPIGCLVYQGKFQGLFNHFDLPNKYLLEPEVAIEESKLLEFINLIIEDRHVIKNIVDTNIEKVKSLAKENLT